ncbi:MAG: hypothetical protein K2Q26_07820 [Bdellovibrionales bacterium]|nr:hypothetical protein [Bdellovibrionales bacterium]
MKSRIYLLSIIFFFIFSGQLSVAEQNVSVIYHRPHSRTSDPRSMGIESVEFGRRTVIQTDSSGKNFQAVTNNYSILEGYKPTAPHQLSLDLNAYRSRPVFGASTYFDATGKAVGHGFVVGSAQTGYVDLAKVGIETFDRFLGGGSQSQLNKSLERYSNHLREELQHSRQANNSLAQAIKESTNTLQSARNSVANTSTQNMALLSSVVGQLSAIDPTEIYKIQTGVAIARDPLSFRSYKMDPNTRKDVADQLNKDLASGNFNKAVEDYESLQSATDHSNVEGFNSHGILVPEKLDPALPTSPLAQFQPESQDPVNKQIVQRLGNKYQAAWGQSKGLENFSDQAKTQYAVGLAHLRFADHIADGDRLRGEAYLRVSQALLEGSLGFAEGAVDQLVSTIKMFPELAAAARDYVKAVKEDPRYIIDSAVNLYHAIPEISKAVWGVAVENWEVIKSGPARERGKVLGAITFEVGFAYFTAGAGTAIKLELQGTRFAVTSTKAVEATKQAFNFSKNFSAQTSAKMTAAISETLDGLRYEYRKVLSQTIPKEKAGESLKLYRELKNSPIPELNKMAEDYGKLVLKSDPFAKLSSVATNAGDILKVSSFDETAVVGVYRSDDINNFLKNTTVYTKPPTASGADVIAIKLDRPLELGRFHGPNNQVGQFFTSWDDIANISFTEAQRKFSLDYLPEMRTKFTIEQNTEIWMSITGPQGNNPGGHLQIYIPTDIKPQWYQN